MGIPALCFQAWRAKARARARGRIHLEGKAILFQECATQRRRAVAGLLLGHLVLLVVWYNISQAVRNQKTRAKLQDSTPCKCSLCQFIAKRFDWSLREWWALFTLKNHEPNNEHWRSLALRKESQRLLWLERSWSGRGSNQAETWRELKELGPLGPLTAFSV